MSGPVRRPVKQAEIVAREITGRIIAEDLPEGARLPTERVMVEEYEVGRSTLREALRLLESRGVITIRSGREGGPIVRRPRASDLGEALTLLLEFEGTQYVEVFAARQALEPRLAAMAARNITPRQLGQLAEAIERTADYPDKSDVFHRENLVFHNVIAEAAGNSVLRMLSQAIESVAGGLAFGGERQRQSFTRKQRESGIAAHRRIYEALAAHDPVLAEAEMQDHLIAAGKIWLAAYLDMTKRPVQMAHQG